MDQGNLQWWLSSLEHVDMLHKESEPKREQAFTGRCRQAKWPQRMIAPYKALRSSTLNAMSLCYLLRTIRRQIPAARHSLYVEFWGEYDTRHSQT
jgi:hypothetical protein